MDSPRTAVVTGASSGIGAATARLLAAQGWQVVAAARRVDRLAALARDVPGVRAQALDVTDVASVAELAAAVGPCDLLVANAGGAFDLDPVADADVDTWARSYDVNVLGTVRTVQALLPSLATSPSGHLVLTGSTAGRWVYEGGGSYVAAKHALAAVRDTLRLELVERGVRVSEVAPGMVRTEEFSLVRFDGDAERAQAVYAGVEALTADDVAEVGVGRVPAGARQHRPGAGDAAAAGRRLQGRPPLQLRSVASVSGHTALAATSGRIRWGETALVARAKRYAAGRARALGLATRGTTAPNRLRRVDRWLVGVHGDLLRRADAPPLVVDLGYGACPVTTVELHARLSRLRPDVDVVGLEIDADRVLAAQSAAADGLSFRRGGFELAGLRPLVVRALNVLRQYDEQAAAQAWQTLLAGLAPGGLLVEGTCDELGRRAAWVALSADGPRTLTLAAHLPSLVRPSELAERLPKSLIHRNVPGEPVHALLQALDDAWHRAAPYAPFGARQRWTAACDGLDWPGADVGRARLGELTVPWASVGPT